MDVATIQAELRETLATLMERVEGLKASPAVQMLALAKVRSEIQIVLVKLDAIALKPDGAQRLEEWG